MSKIKIACMQLKVLQDKYDNIEHVCFLCIDKNLFSSAITKVGKSLFYSIRMDSIISL